MGSLRISPTIKFIEFSSLLFLLLFFLPLLVFFVVLVPGLMVILDFARDLTKLSSLATHLKYGLIKPTVE